MNQTGLNGMRATSTRTCTLSAACGRALHTAVIMGRLSAAPHTAPAPIHTLSQPVCSSGTGGPALVAPTAAANSAEGPKRRGRPRKHLQKSVVEEKSTSPGLDEGSQASVLPPSPVAASKKKTRTRRQPGPHAGSADPDSQAQAVTQGLQMLPADVAPVQDPVSIRLLNSHHHGTALDQSATSAPRDPHHSNHDPTPQTARTSTTALPTTTSAPSPQRASEQATTTASGADSMHSLPPASTSLSATSGSGASTRAEHSTHSQAEKPQQSQQEQQPVVPTVGRWDDDEAALGFEFLPSQLLAEAQQTLRARAEPSTISTPHGSKAPSGNGTYEKDSSSQRPQQLATPATSRQPTPAATAAAPASHAPHTAPPVLSSRWMTAWNTPTTPTTAAAPSTATPSTPVLSRQPSKAAATGNASPSTAAATTRPASSHQITNPGSSSRSAQEQPATPSSDSQQQQQQQQQQQLGGSRVQQTPPAGLYLGRGLRPSRPSRPPHEEAYTPFWWQLPLDLALDSAPQDPSALSARAGAGAQDALSPLSEGGLSYEAKGSASNTLFVKGLPSGAPEGLLRRALMEAFRESGEIQQIRVPTTSVPGAARETKGIAFVVFDSAQSKNRALQSPVPLVVLGRAVYVDSNPDRPGSTAYRPSSQPRTSASVGTTPSVNSPRAGKYSQEPYPAVVGAAQHSPEDATSAAEVLRHWPSLGEEDREEGGQPQARPSRHRDTAGGRAQRHPTDHSDSQTVKAGGRMDSGSRRDRRQSPEAHAAAERTRSQSQPPSPPSRPPPSLRGSATGSKTPRQPPSDSGRAEGGAPAGRPQPASGPVPAAPNQTAAPAPAPPGTPLGRRGRYLG